MTNDEMLEMMDRVNQGTQNADVLEYMMTHDGITQHEANKNVHVSRLSARIMDLKKAGFEIETSWITVLNWRKKTVRVKVYRLAEQQKGNET